ncbi:AraC family transcriptional regulator [Lacinutrix sp. 5H-3-7-4]|uniref:AraC family transcriptional regulator n=1 Tax=Lacinutrix sp. (strain 5H-3-7-4) TaxID=983544 RepID=UPI00020A338C|nr:AraC family transcriptional regulator [Lacinutrix sp. 5H-3-7-4]AEH02565.1 transcriptional regulator, AraC family [Lacinutrix sp. 5H-3-7-4]
MASINKIEKGKVFMTCKIEEEYTWENVYPQHIVAYIYSGELEITYGKNTLTFVAGDTVLVPKNQLSRSIKKPINNQPFKCLSITLPEEELRKFYLNQTILETWNEDVLKQRPVKSHTLLHSYFKSLLPYFEIQDKLPDAIVPLKIQEVLTIIDEVDKRASSILGTFSELGKIDIEKYMEEHFMYNLPLEKFAYLTGRSLTTFKTDFKKTFKNTPGKWLTEKRLNLAHYKLNKEKLKSSDVYLSVGFENLSHFSFAFKKAFGYSPSALANN